MNTETLPAQAQGQPLPRVDGRLKVTGAAKYPAEFRPPGAACGYAVMSTISKGTITGIDTADAEKSAGVRVVLTHLNAPKIGEPPDDKKSEGIRIEQRAPLADAKISYGGQYVALVVADSLEQARHAASLIKVTYAEERPALSREDVPETERWPEENQGERLQVKKGDASKALAKRHLTVVKATYSTPVETHNPMECSATVAVWDAPDRLTIYDATQYVKGAQAVVANAFNLLPEEVRVICPFVGGAFGCKGPVWPHTLLAVMGAKVAGVPVRLELTRQQMFSGTGHRPPLAQTISLGAGLDGRLQAIKHHSTMVTSPVGHWIEMSGAAATGVLYDAPSIEYTHALSEVNVATPSFMRAPGECPGTYALECAMDELAWALKMDPLRLRQINNSPRHPIKGVPFSSKHLKECYEVGAQKFGWAQRSPEPRSMKKDGKLVGWGMATATYPAHRWDATVHVELRGDGTAVFRCATHDLGTGGYTALAQIGADAVALPVEKVSFELGDSSLPFGPVAGGSNSIATVGSAIVVASRALVAKLAAIAVADSGSPFKGRKSEEIILVSPGLIGVRGDARLSEPVADLLQRAGLPSLAAEAGAQEEKNEAVAFQSFGAHFCAVEVDPDLPRVQVTRFVSAMDCGRVINPKTGGSQIIGGIVMGIGMALEEETAYDPATGLPVTRNLADYHIPVNADIRSIEWFPVGTPDFAFNPMGARGMGEIGITGAAAAVANAVFHATGKRVRDLPITLDKLL